MPLKVQRTVLELIVQVTGGALTTETPAWLLRPGKAECRQRWPLIRDIYHDLAGQELPETMPVRDRRAVDGVLRVGDTWRIVEVDETQHFNKFRGMTLARYPADLPLGFDRRVWHETAQGEPKQGGGFARPTSLFQFPGGRHRQRAFRDALADILPPLYGFAGTLRVADFEVGGWLTSPDAAVRMTGLLSARL